MAFLKLVPEVVAADAANESGETEVKKKIKLMTNECILIFNQFPRLSVRILPNTFPRHKSAVDSKPEQDPAQASPVLDKIRSYDFTTTSIIPKTTATPDLIAEETIFVDNWHVTQYYFNKQLLPSRYMKQESLNPAKQTKDLCWHPDERHSQPTFNICMPMLCGWAPDSRVDWLSRPIYPLHTNK